MFVEYVIRRNAHDVAPFLSDIQTQADSERNALGWLPMPAYVEAAQQRKIFLLLANDGENLTYAGHLLSGGIFPNLRVMQTVVHADHRRRGLATTLLRSLVAYGEKESYQCIVARVASDLVTANSFYGCNGFVTSHQRKGGNTRNRIINVRVRQLETPNLLSLMSAPPAAKIDIYPRKRSPEAPIYTIDLNVFFDAVREKRPRSDLAGALVEAAFRHQIRLATTQEFEVELRRTSFDPTDDPILALARRIPSVPKQGTETLKRLTPLIERIVFPERAEHGSLSKTDRSDVLHLCSSIAAGVAGYITSDEKVLSARDQLQSQFGLDVIGLSEFVALLEEQPPDITEQTQRRSRYFRIDIPSPDAAREFLKKENANFRSFLSELEINSCKLHSVSDSDGLIGVSVLKATPALEQPCKSLIYVQQQHPFSSTVADYLISQQIRSCTRESPRHLLLHDEPAHPITRRIAISLGFQPTSSTSPMLSKLALGHPVTSETWKKTRLSLERIGGIEVEADYPSFDRTDTKVVAAGKEHLISLFDLETLLSPAIFALPQRAAVIVPITRNYASDLLGTDDQYSLLDIPEARFLNRRTYFNTTRASRVMIPGSVIAFYESSSGDGRSAIVAIARIVDVTSTPTEATPEQLQRQGVVEDLRTLTKQTRTLASTFDCLIPLKRLVSLTELRKIGCANGANFVSATRISWSHLVEIIQMGFTDV